jgi:hypothetical protein
MRTLLPKIDDYPAHLEACWRDHLAPREEDAPTDISLFAGCGGSSLGYSMAGYRELLAVEWDEPAVETFKLNFPGVPVWQGDIAELSVEECLSFAGTQAGKTKTTVVARKHAGCYAGFSKQSVPPVPQKVESRAQESRVRRPHRAIIIRILPLEADG